MSTARTKLKQIDHLPISWLSDGRLKSSLLLRHSYALSEKPAEFLKLLLGVHLTRRTAQSLALQADERVLENASKEYLRCILAKCVANAYRNAMARYRNEAARKQSFTRLLEIFEGCHLSTSDPLNRLLDISETDRLAGWVKSEFDRLLVERFDISSEHATNLNAARAEFRGAIKQLEDITGCSWKESERFNKSLVVNSLFPPTLVEDENTWRWGTQWHSDVGVLNINPPMLFMLPVRRGLLARESAALLSPLIFDRMPEAPRPLCEQSEYLAYRLLEGKSERELWSQARHGLRRMTRIAGHELIDFFQDYEMMVGDSLYRELWSRLKEIGTARMTFADYRIILQTLASRPTRLKFGTSEIRLMNLLAKKPDIKAGEAARVLRLSIPTVMGAIRDITRKAGLRFTIIVDMRKLGLTEHLLLARTRKIGVLLRAFSRFPFCRQVFRTYGSSDLFCVFDIPNDHVNFTREFVGEMVSRQLVSEFKLVVLERNFQAVNFERYDATDGLWNVHWDSWGMRLKESLSKGAESNWVSSGQGQRVKLDKLDLRILSSLQNDCRVPYASVGRSLGVSGAYIGRKIERMFRDQVFSYALWPMKIAAEDWGIVSLSSSRSVVSILAQYLSSLPAWRGGFVSGDFDGLVAMVWTPSGEIRQFFKAIDDRLIRTGDAEAQSLNAVGEWMLGRWLPVDPYPWDLVGEEGNWIFDDERYMSLLN